MLRDAVWFTSQVIAVFSYYTFVFTPLNKTAKQIILYVLHIDPLEINADR